MGANGSSFQKRARRHRPHERSPPTPLESAEPFAAEAARVVYGLWRAETQGDAVCELLSLSAGGGGAACGAPTDEGRMMQAPFPWFGGKRKVAAEVWSRFGAVQNYVEPFFGSGAVLLGRPDPSGNETINDLDGYVANFWRALKHSPDETAAWADHQVNENDLHARHVWLLQQRETLRPRLEGDPDWHDPKIAGWWVWGIACWIGSGFCSGNGPWWVGVNRQLVHLGTTGQGVNRKLVHLGDNGRGERLAGWFSALSDRLRFVRVCSGDWSRVCGPSVTRRNVRAISTVLIAKRWRMTCASGRWHRATTR